MRKIALLITILIVSCFAYGRQRNIVKDGLPLGGVDGKISDVDVNGVCYFKPDNDLVDLDGKNTIPSGTKIAVLDSVALENILKSRQTDPNSYFRVWGKITNYKNTNYLYPTYFLSITQAPGTEAIDEQEDSPAKINTTDDEPTLPAEILAKLQKKTVIQPTQLKNDFKLSQDHILADKTGFIEKDSQGKAIFRFDSFGRNIEKITITLHPCKTLELAEIEQSNKLEPVRFKASGIVTEYKGQYYLLLQKAARTYSHGNFTR